MESKHNLGSSLAEDKQIDSDSTSLAFMQHKSHCALEPADIYLDDHIMDLKFSPCANVIALGQVTGEVRMYSYQSDNTTEQLYFNFHSDSCRAVEFSPDGNIVYTGSKDQSLAAITNGKMAGRVLDAHPAPIFSLLHIQDGNIIASGDDDGMIRIWDLRVAHKGKKHAICMEFKEHDGTIMDMIYNEKENMLLSCSSDGMLAVYDVRKSELYAMSDCFEEDLNAMTLQKEGKKVLCTTSEGTINIFSWDFFGDCNDRIVGHPGSIDCIVKYDESTVITGCEDGLIRAVSVLPNKIISIISDPLDAQDDGFHIQKLALSHDKCLIASCSLDDMVKILDVSNLSNRQMDDDDFDEVAYEAQIQERNFKTAEDKKKAKQQKQEEQKNGQEDQIMDANNANNESDWEDSDSESDYDSESDDSDDHKKDKKKNKKLNPKNATLQQSKKMIEHEQRKDFFDGL